MNDPNTPTLPADRPEEAASEGPGAARAGAKSAEPATDPAAERAARIAAQTAAAAEAVRRRRVVDGAKNPILPDCCNLGIALRILVPINVVAILLSFGLASGPVEALNRFIDISIILEPVALASLVLLCALKKEVNGQSIAVQWAVAVGVPALLAGLVALATYRLIAPATSEGSILYWVMMRVFIGAGAAYVLVEILRLRARAYSPSLSEARLQALQARIRPHFLFNSLNTVLGLMRSDPRRAERTLENLADLFRVFMRDTRELVPLDEEVITCQQYLSIEQLRLGPRLQVAWENAEMPGDALLPSLLLQPLIENSVHHGIEPRTEPGLVSIRITKPGERVRVEISNPAPAAESAPVRPGNQMALSNVRERLMLLYDMEAELKTSVEAGQFRLFLEFPYRKERRRRDVRRHFHPDR